MTVRLGVVECINLFLSQLPVVPAVEVSDTTMSNRVKKLVTKKSQSNKRKITWYSPSSTFFK
jgi:hypothetical protein